MESSELRDLLARDPFEPFRIRLSSGDSYVVRDAQSIAIMKTRMFVALPGGDEWVFIPLLHVAALESVGNGHPRRRGRRR